MIRGEAMDIDKLTAATILSNNVMCEIFDEVDPVERERLIQDLTDKAKILSVKNKFENLLQAFKKKEKEFLAEKKKEIKRVDNTFNNYSSFGEEYEPLFCGNWIADDNGIRTFTMFGERLACYHPIIPISRLVNAETGKEKIKLAYKKGFKWKEVIVDKGVIASANKIVSLADYGISVTSETAKALVGYLSDIENFNINLIKIQVSTSKLGWIDKQFMPYGADIIFDNETRFKTTFESIKECGDINIWINLIKKVRKTKRFEAKIYLVGALASALIEPLNALPFIINLWGDTGKGKTVAMMLAASVWAYPGESDYVTDPKSTVTALELRLDFLNNFPMLIDDMAQLKDKFGGDFSELVYMLCSGKGKDRANANLGLNKSTTWRNVILTNGEHSLVTETMQGGAINRIIDVEMSEGYIFPNGNEVVEIIKQNYGFCGKKFIEIIDEIGLEEIKNIQQGFLQRINQRAKELGVDKEEKQTLPMSIILTTDKIATDYIFCDGEYLDFDACVDLLKNKGEVSENERAYEFILSEVAINMNKFKPDNYTGEYKGEIWGSIENGYAIILNNAFNKICERGNFSSKAFLSWAGKQDLLSSSGGKNTKTKRLNGSVARCVWLKIDSIDKDGFTNVSDEEQEKLPFM
jgi:hypothetical protein